MTGITVKGLDHVHVHVANRDKAAAWFKRVLGLQIASPFAEWARDPDGPLFLSTHEGHHCLALFQRNSEHNKSGDHTIAFKVGASDFIGLVNQLDDLQLIDKDRTKLSRDDIVDHQLAWSLYFLDPDGNRFEVTSYDYDEIGAYVKKPDDR